MHVLDVTSMAWRRIAAAGTPAVSHHTLTAAGTDLWLIGGWDGRRRTARVMRFDTATERWSEPPVNGDAPCGLSSHSATLVGERTIVVGEACLYLIYPLAICPFCLLPLASSPSPSAPLPLTPGIRREVFATSG